MLQRILVPLVLLIALVLGLQFMPSRATANGDECPPINVHGFQDKGRIAKFTANVGSNAEVTYNWTVSDGGIETGQGTSTIDVAGMESNLVTATVEIGRLPPECSRSASSTVMLE